MGQVLMSQIRNHCRKIIRCGMRRIVSLRHMCPADMHCRRALEKILELSIENRRYEKGETLHNIIDFSTGYVKR